MSNSPSKRFTVLQPRTADRPSTEKEACWEICNSLFSNPRESLLLLQSIKWKTNPGSLNYPQMSPSFVFSLDGAQNGTDLETKTNEELKYMINRMRDEISYLRSFSGSTVTVKKEQQNRSNNGQLPFPASLKSELDNEKDEDETAKVALPTRNNKNNLLSGVVYALTLGSVNIAGEATPPPTISSNPQDVKSIPVPADVVVVPLIARVTTAVESEPRLAQTNSTSEATTVVHTSTPPRTPTQLIGVSKPKTPIGPNNNITDTSDHDVNISYIGTQRIVKRQEPGIPTAITTPTAVPFNAAGAVLSTEGSTRTQPPDHKRAAAETMNLTQLTQAMKTALSLSSKLSVTETVSSACSLLKIAPVGNVKADAVSCYLALPDTTPSTKQVASSSSFAPKIDEHVSSNPLVPKIDEPVSTTADIAAATAKNLVGKVRSFYRLHNPDKTDKEIADIMKYYDGKESELIRKLEKKYNTIFDWKSGK